MEHKEIYVGSCQCQGVQYKVNGVFAGFFLCHCSRCRKDTGSAHGSNVFVKEGILDYTQGKDLVSHYNVPNTRHTKHFCITCACPVAAEDEGSGMIVIPAGSLDESPELTPTAQICFDSRASWVDRYRDERCMKFGGLPG